MPERMPSAAIGSFHVATFKGDADVVAARFELVHPCIEAQRPRRDLRQPRDHRRLQIPAMQAQVRHAKNLAIIFRHHAHDDRARAVVTVFGHRRCDGSGFERLSQAQVIQHSRRIRRKGDTGALIDELRRALVDGDGMARLCERERGGEAADAAADNGNVHGNRKIR